MSLFGQTKRHSPSTPKPRVRSPLPSFNGDLEKKYDLGSTSTPYGRFFTLVYLPLPRFPFSSSSRTSDTSLMNGHGSSKGYSHPRGRRYARVCLPLPHRLYIRIPSINTKRRFAMLLLVIVGILVFILGFRKKPGGGSTWTPPFVDPDTLVITPEEVAMIWEWEILSGHHPSTENREQAHIRLVLTVISAGNGSPPSDVQEPICTGKPPPFSWNT